MKSPTNSAPFLAANSLPSFSIALSLSSLYELWARSRMVGAAAARRPRPPTAASAPAAPAARANSRRVMSTAVLLSLDGTGRQARDVVVQEEREQHDHRHRGEQRPRHEGPPEEHVAPDQVDHHPGRHRLAIRRRDEGQGVDELP